MLQVKSSGQSQMDGIQKSSCIVLFHFTERRDCQIKEWMNMAQQQTLAT